MNKSSKALKVKLNLFCGNLITALEIESNQEPREQSFAVAAFHFRLLANIKKTVWSGVPRD